MSYTPTIWSNGDTITAAKLNKIENGIVEASESGGGGGAFVVTFTYNESDYWEMDVEVDELLSAIRSEATIIGKLFPDDAVYPNEYYLTSNIRYYEYEEEAFMTYKRIIFEFIQNIYNGDADRNELRDYHMKVLIDYNDELEQIVSEKYYTTLNSISSGEE